MVWVPEAENRRGEGGGVSRKEGKYMKRIKSSIPNKATILHDAECCLFIYIHCTYGHLYSRPTAN